MKKNLRPADRWIRVAFAAVLIFVAVVVLKEVFLRLLFLMGAVFTLFEAWTAKCDLEARLGAETDKEPLTERALFLIGIIGVQTVLGYQWIMGGWEKLFDPKFVGGMPATLAKFAANTPFPWYKDWLTGFFTANASLFAYAVEWGEFIVGLTLLASGWLYLYTKDHRHKRWAIIGLAVALFFAAFMNANFYLASRTSTGGGGSNVVMFWIELALLYVWKMLFINSQRDRK